MSSWLNDEEVLVGEGSGTESPCSPRLMVFPTGCDTPRSGRRCRGASASSRESVVGHPEPMGTMGKARELFVLCDKEGKGFITKRDMQRLQGELTLTPEQLESVFESLDTDKNGFLTPVEFNTGLKGDLMWVEDDAVERQEQIEPEEKEVDPGEVRFTQILTDLGVVKDFTDHWELCRLWCDLHKERPELLSLLEEVLLQAVYQLQDSLNERHSLEQALHRREREHDRVVQSIYEEMETRVREEKERQLAQLEESIHALGCEQADIRLQNQQLHSHNSQLQEQLESSRVELQTALDQLELLKATISEQERTRERRERDHDRLVQSIYEEMETQIREERERNLAQDSFRQWDRMQQIAEELKRKDQELEISLSKQKELEERIHALGCEQADIRLQNQQLHSHNTQLQEQLESSRVELQTALDQLELLKATISEQERTRERTVLKVSRNIQKEKKSLQRQLDLLRDMNQRLRDDSDAQQTQKRASVNQPSSGHAPHHGHAPLHGHTLLLSPIVSPGLHPSFIPTHHHLPHCLSAGHHGSHWTHPFNHPYVKPC